MAAVSKGYGIGDTVFVHYQLPSSNYFLPQSRVVKDVKTNTSGNSATVSFTNGESVVDVAGLVTVYITQALCAAGIVTATIAAVAASVVLDTTTSIVSTAGNSSTTLGRIG